MSVLFTDVMTVYNHRCDPDTGKETWSRSVINGVQWVHNKAMLSVQTKIKSVESMESITIDFQRNYGNKPYLPPQEYDLQEEESIENYWTLRNGTDLLVNGEPDIEITSSADIKKLKDSCQYVVTVSEVSDNRNRPHLRTIKVVGK